MLELLKAELSESFKEAKRYLLVLVVLLAIAVCASIASVNSSSSHSSVSTSFTTGLVVGYVLGKNNH